ncbi:hypothetical protein [Ureibacillus xyleni]|uniref:hypothetical protein n=1 Tax=Ureibacillus xyleni TaxID=614648 RepID=UPI000BE39EA6|nr:hypothetical protein [Ureibacillus xyleni]
MNTKKTIWDDLKDLPRNEKIEKETWQKIETKLSKPKYFINVLTGFVTIALVFLIFALLTSTSKEEMAIQQASEHVLESVYFLHDSEFDQFDVQPSSWYTFIRINDDEQILKEFQNQLTANKKVVAPQPSTIYLHGDYVDLILKYPNDSLKKYKVLLSEPGYIYDVDTKEWYFNDHPNFENTVYKLTREQFTSWLPMFVLFNAIFTTLAEKFLKRKYKVKKITYGGENTVAKYTIYGSTILLGFILFLFIFKQFVVHIFWILIIFAILLTINIMIESKYGQNKAAIYMLISSSIGLLLFVLFFTLNL